MNGDGWNPIHATHKHGDGMGMLTMAAGGIMGSHGDILRIIRVNDVRTSLGRRANDW